MEQTVLAALVLAVALIAGVGLARRVGVPHPIVLVVGGLGLGLLPGLPRVTLQPDVVFLVFLPPLVFAGAFLLTPHALAAQRRSVALLAVALVLVTAAAVAVALRLLLDVPWAVAVAAGAIVSPTDPVAAGAILSRVGAPRPLVDLVEGESLVNDATALVLYGVAVEAATSGRFSLGSTTLTLVLAVAGSVAIGVVVGLSAVWLRRRLDDPETETAFSLLTPFLAYLPADRVGASGILATVTVALVVAARSTSLSAASTRIQTFAFWRTLVFLLEGGLFLLVGLELPEVVGRLHVGAARLAVDTVVVAVVVGTRLAWQLVVAPLADAGQGGRAERLVVAWSGSRGPITLAAALALPLTLHGGVPFPRRDVVLFLAAATVVVTLVGQGLTLAPLLARLGVGGGEGAARRQELEARRVAAEAALARGEELAEQDHDGDADALRVALDRYRLRLSRLEEVLGAEDAGAAVAGEDPVPRRRDLRHELLVAERDAVARLHDEGRISGEVMRRVERDLDLEEARLHG